MPEEREVAEEAGGVIAAPAASHAGREELDMYRGAGLLLFEFDGENPVGTAAAAVVPLA